MGKNIVGFDFGEKKLKIVWNSGDSIKKTLCVDVPDNLMDGGRILSMDAMSELIRQTAKENGIGKGKAALVFPASYVYSKVVTMPIMNHQQILYNLPYEFADFLKQEKGLYKFDYIITGTEADEEGKVSGMQLFATAALKTDIEFFRDMLKHAGFRLTNAVPVEYACTALLRQYIAGHEEVKDEDCCIADIGYTGARVLIYHGSDFVQSRNIEYGTRGISQLVSSHWNVDEHVAYSYTMSDYNHCLSEDYCTEYYDSLAVEVMKTINFFNYNNRDAELKKIYLAGGGTAIPQISEKISDMTGLPMHVVSSIMPEGDNAGDRDMAAAAFGCTL